MGTPQFSVPSLTALYEAYFDIVLVVTQPDRVRGRGRKVMPSPVKRVAESLGLNILQPETIRAQCVIEHMKHLAPDVIVVVAFGQILPASLLKLPRKGAINLHASLLPKYRGPAPVQWAIINGERETGITTMLMDEKMDTGDILLSERVPIKPDDTCETLQQRLAVMGADLLVNTLRKIEKGDIRPIPQDHSKATYAPMLKKSDGRIDWHQPAAKIEAFIRGMNPWPGAFTFFNKKRLKIFKAEVVERDPGQPPGTVIKGAADQLHVAAGKYQLSISEIQSESGRRLPVAEFLRGCKIPEGAVLD